jgi:hypothetical protein
VGTQGPNGDAELLDFVKRLLADEYAGGPGSVEVFVGRYPDEPVVDLPSIKNGRLLGSVMHRRGPQFAAVEAVIDVPSSPEETLTEYEHALFDAGWEMAREHGPSGPPGFLTAAVGYWRTYWRGHEDPVLVVNALGKQDAGTDLHLRLEWGMPRNTPRRPEPDLAWMPPLIPPPDVKLSPQHGFGGQNAWTVGATTESAKSAAELEKYFGSQLNGLGWTRVAGEATDNAAWSSWTSPGQQEWKAILSVMPAFPGEKSLFFHAEASTREEPQPPMSRRWPRRL